MNEWVEASYTVCISGPTVQLSLDWGTTLEGKVKLNVDGSRLNSSGNIGAGGVLQENNCDWLGSVNLGEGQVVDAEIWGPYFGVQLAINKSISSF